MSWSETLIIFKKILPYLWPRKSWRLKSYIILCLLSVLASTLVNLSTPIIKREIGKFIAILKNKSKYFFLVNSLTIEDSKEFTSYSPKMLIIIVYGLIWLRCGSEGIIEGLRCFLWINISHPLQLRLKVSIPNKSQ